MRKFYFLAGLFLNFTLIFGEISLIHSSVAEVTIDFSTGSPTIEDWLQPSPGQTSTLFHQIQLAGCQKFSSNIGEPNLPQAEVMVGIPQTGEVILKVKPGNFHIYSNINIAPIPKISWDSTNFVKSPVYQVNNFFPGSLAVIKEIGFMRDIRVAKILISPAQYNPVTKELKIYENLNISLQFATTPSTNYRGKGQNPEFFDRIYEKVLLNGTEAKNWKIEPVQTQQKSGSKIYPPTTLLPRNFFEISENWLKVKIETTGVYKITYQDLNNLGLNPGSINPKTFRLFNIGDYATNTGYPDSMIEIPIYIYGEADNSFDPQDYIIFWGNSIAGWDSTHQRYQFNLFTNYNYYWLTYGASQNGSRIASVSSSNGNNPLRIESAHRTIHFEQDLLCPARSGLLWLWQYITKAADKPDTSIEIAFNLPNADSLNKITFSVYQPAANLSATINIYLNQTFIGTRQVRTALYTPYIFSLETLPAINSDNNILRIQIAGSTEMQLYIDWFDAEYYQDLKLSGAPRALEFSLDSGEVQVNLKGVSQTPFILDVTDKFRPRLVTDFNLIADSLKFQTINYNKSYYYITDSRKILKPISILKRQPGKLKMETSPAHYYIIAPDELYDGARSLERYRSNNIVGIPQARAKAVRLSDIYDEYTFGIEEPGAIREFFKEKAPIYGLLLGDGTYDYRNNLGFTDFPVVPPYEQGFDFDPDVYSQSALAMDAFYAQFDNGALDMILARATCRTTEQVSQFYNKVREYEAKPYGFWNSRFLLLADDEWKGVDKPDDGMIWTHIVDCEAMGNLLKERLEPVKIYLTEYPFAIGNEYAKPLARASFIRALNEGSLLFCYFGHGAGWQLAHEKAFYVEEDVVKVNNGRRNPFSFFGSCGVGRFEDTRFQSIAEELVRIDDGAIGTVGATKATTCGTNLSFANDMFGSFNDSVPVTIGQAFFAAWHWDIKYHLFGDPAVVLNLPEKRTPVQINPSTFRLGELCAVSDSLVPENYPANYYLTAYGPEWRRTYSSYFYGRINTINYILPGFELFRGTGTISQPQINIPFFIPRGQNPTMRGDYYQEQVNTAMIQLGIGKGLNYYSLVKDSIPMSYDTTPRTDTIGPNVNLYADHQLIRAGSSVPAQFTFSGTIADPSGILVLPNTVTGCSLNFIDPTSGKPVSLADYFIYSNNSYTQGQFIYPEPVKLTEAVDTLVIVAYDCQLNRTEKQLEVRRLDQGLKITNALVYPNPVKEKTNFAFTLTQPASVRINVYTINGRPVKTIPEKFCSLGYNQIEWDGRDDSGILPANGVYLYQIRARISEGRNQESSYNLTEKLLILR